MFNPLSLISNLYKTNSLLSDSRLSEIIKDSEERVAKHYNIPKDILKSKYTIENLPEIFIYGVRYVGGVLEGYIKKVGKILGMYNPENDHISIGYKNLYSEKRFRETVIHELIHKVQKVLGKIYTLPRYLLEKEAYEVTEKLT